VGCYRLKAIWSGIIYEGTVCTLTHTLSLSHTHTHTWTPPFLSAMQCTMKGSNGPEFGVASVRVHADSDAPICIVRASLECQQAPQREPLVSLCLWSAATTASKHRSTRRGPMREHHYVNLVCFVSSHTETPWGGPEERKLSRLLQRGNGENRFTAIFL